MMDKTGGPAFPNARHIGDKDRYFGMTLRDYMAARALNAFIIGSADRGELQGAEFFDVIARHSYKFADAMIKTRGE